MFNDRSVTMDEESEHAYLSDFMSAIRSVDDEIFLKAGHPSGSIIVLPSRPEFARGYVVQNLAGYYPRFLSGFMELVHSRKKRNIYISAYAIFRPLVLQYVERKLERSTVDGMGDHEIKKLWQICAIQLVRYRILASGYLFPNINLRTQKNMVKYRHLFTKSGNDFEALKNIAKELAKPVRGWNQSEPWGVDVFWTTQIVARLLDSGKSFEEAVVYMTRD